MPVVKRIKSKPADRWGVYKTRYFVTSGYVLDTTCVAVFAGRTQAELVRAALSESVTGKSKSCPRYRFSSERIRDEEETAIGETSGA